MTTRGESSCRGSPTSGTCICNLHDPAGPEEPTICPHQRTGTQTSRRHNGKEPRRRKWSWTSWLVQSSNAPSTSSPPLPTSPPPLSSPKTRRRRHSPSLLPPTFFPASEIFSIKAAFRSWFPSSTSSFSGSSLLAQMPLKVVAFLAFARRRPYFSLLGLLTILFAIGRMCSWWWERGSKHGFPSAGSWSHGRYHDHVSRLRPEDSEYRALASLHPWTAASVMETYCPVFNASLLPPDIFERRIYIAANLKDNEGIMANMIEQLTLLASLYPDPGAHLFVSIYESGSTDATCRWLGLLQDELREMGVPSEVVAGGEKRRVGEEDRIQFLARMRNEAMGPLYRMHLKEGEIGAERGGSSSQATKGAGWGRRLAGEGSPRRDAGRMRNGIEISMGSNDIREMEAYESSEARGSTRPPLGSKVGDGDHSEALQGLGPSTRAIRTLVVDQGGRENRHDRFDHVVFLNDVYFCAYEILRLLLYNADLACGLDFFLEPFPDLHPDTAAVRKELTFYDLWVARDEEGQRFQWAQPFVKHVRGQSRQDAEGDAEYEEAFPVFCCWNGLAVLDAAPFYRGLRFRSVRPGEGVISECSNLCTDLWANGHRKVVLDPQVKLAYDEPTYEQLHALKPPRYPSLYRVDREIERVVEAPRAVDTCFLETGRRKLGAMVRFEECAARPLEEVLAQAVRLEELCYDTRHIRDINTDAEGDGRREEMDVDMEDRPRSSRERGGAAAVRQPNTIPRNLLQLAPFPVRDASFFLSRIAGWLSLSSRQFLFSSKRERRRIQAHRQRDKDAGLHGWRAAWAEWTRLHVSPRWRVMLYDEQEARAVMHAHFPLTGPVLARLEERGEWRIWRTLTALALLYHHGGVLVPAGQKEHYTDGVWISPRRSMDCLWGVDGKEISREVVSLAFLPYKALEDKIPERSELKRAQGPSRMERDRPDETSTRQGAGSDLVPPEEHATWLSLAPWPSLWNNTTPLAPLSTFAAFPAAVASEPYAAFAPLFPGILVAPRHDPGVEALIQALFFSTQALDGLQGTTISSNLRRGDHEAEIGHKKPRSGVVRHSNDRVHS